MHDSLAAGDTYRDKNAVHVLGLAGLVCAHEVGQALDIVDAHHVDVVVEAERLDEGKVDLKGDVTLVLLIGGEHAERHAVWITVRKRKKGEIGQFHFKALERRKELVDDRQEYSHIHDFSGFVNSNCQVVLLLCSEQQLLQGCACTLNPKQGKAHFIKTLNNALQSESLSH